MMTAPDGTDARRLRPIREGQACGSSGVALSEEAAPLPKAATSTQEPCWVLRRLLRQVTGDRSFVDTRTSFTRSIRTFHRPPARSGCVTRSGPAPAREG